MGKVRRQRQKYHLSAKSKSGNDHTKTEDNDGKCNLLTSNIFKSDENIFAGINIKHEDLYKNIPRDFDATSVISSKSRREEKLETQHLTKKEKLKLRREKFMKKIDVIEQSVKEAKNRKKRQKTVVVGDLKPLMDALPSLEELADSRTKKEFLKLNRKPKGILKLKQRQKQQSADVKMFKKVINDKIFRSNPTQTISEYLKQKLAKERPS